MEFDDELLKTNVSSKGISKEILLYGTCISKEHPRILKQFEGSTRLHICLEKEHVNKAAWKITSIVRINEVKKITILTPDGSPHCIQLHFVGEDLRNLFQVEVRHFVIKKGELKAISGKSIRASRHLSEVERLIE